MVKVDFSDYAIVSMRGDVNSFHLEWLDEEYAEENRHDEMDWTIHKMIPVLSWVDNETLDKYITLWLSREGLYHLTCETRGTEFKPITYDYDLGFKTANEAIANYTV